LSLTNAGKTRFQGAEVEIGYHPCMLPDFSISGGYAHHDTRYVHFSFIDPDEGLLVADGQRLELTPRDLWNAMLSYRSTRGPGAWFAIRHQNQRPFDKINEAYMPSFFEYDAGVSWDFGIVNVSVGRNPEQPPLRGGERSDAQLYVAPRGAFAELGSGSEEETREYAEKSPCGRRAARACKVVLGAVRQSATRREKTVRRRQRSADGPFPF
jgi:hypothetical protein